MVREKILVTAAKRCVGFYYVKDDALFSNAHINGGHDMTISVSLHWTDQHADLNDRFRSEILFRSLEGS